MHSNRSYEARREKFGRGVGGFKYPPLPKASATSCLFSTSGACEVEIDGTEDEVEDCRSTIWGTLADVWGGVQGRDMLASVEGDGVKEGVDRVGDDAESLLGAVACLDFFLETHGVPWSS